MIGFVIQALLLGKPPVGRFLNTSDLLLQVMPPFIVSRGLAVELRWDDAVALESRDSPSGGVLQEIELR